MYAACSAQCNIGSADVRKAVLAAAMEQLPGLTKEEVQLLLDENRGADAPREYFITTQDVLNVRTKVEQEQFRSSANDADSVRQFYNKHKDQVGWCLWLVLVLLAQYPACAVLPVSDGTLLPWYTCIH
jgi:hypothetical protein